MNHLALVLLVVVLPVINQDVAAEETATLRLAFRYAGTPPVLPAIKPDRDARVCDKRPIPDERLVVHPENRGIKNVIVYADLRRQPSIIPDGDPPRRVHKLSTNGCRFDPHILLARTGDQVVFQPTDPVIHNPNVGFLAHLPTGPSTPKGSPQTWKLQVTEPAPVLIRCNIHSWMKAWLVVLNHPFVAISDEDGKLEIGGLPVGQQIRFRVFHESGRIAVTTLDGGEVAIGRFQITLEPGVNDLGVVQVPASTFGELNVPPN